MARATGGIFMHRDKYYKQIDGVTMGSPLGPTLANFFVAHQEMKLLRSGCDFLPRFYCRYVDDIFCVFQSHASYQRFYDHLSQMHVSLKFTSEIGKNSLAFLDTSISLPSPASKSTICTTTVYRKKTYTGLLLNYDAVCPRRWKIGLIHCFLNRAYRICSDWSLLHDEFSHLQKIFMSNGYPSHVFQKCLKIFLDKKFSGTESSSQAPVECTVVLPYFGKSSLIFKKKLVVFFKTEFHINLRCAFTSCRVGMYFPLKNRTPHILSSNVVYKFTCLRDVGASYIGKTKRHLVTRVREHGSRQSAIFSHLENCNTCLMNFNISCFSILANAKCDYDCNIKEALFIKQLQPTLNSNLYSCGSSFQLKLF